MLDSYKWLNRRLLQEIIHRKKNINGNIGKHLTSIFFYLLVVGTSSAEVDLKCASVLEQFSESSDILLVDENLPCLQKSKQNLSSSTQSGIIYLLAAIENKKWKLAYWISENTTSFSDDSDAIIKRIYFDLYEYLENVKSNKIEQNFFDEKDIEEYLKLIDKLEEENFGADLEKNFGADLEKRFSTRKSYSTAFILAVMFCESKRYEILEKSKNIDEIFSSLKGISDNFNPSAKFHSDEFADLVHLSIAANIYDQGCLDSADDEFGFLNN